MSSVSEAQGTGVFFEVTDQYGCRMQRTVDGVELACPPDHRRDHSRIRHPIEYRLDLTRGGTTCVGAAAVAEAGRAAGWCRGKARGLELTGPNGLLKLFHLLGLDMGARHRRRGI